MPKHTPKRLWRGTDRARLRKAKNALLMLRGRDDRMAVSGMSEDVVTFYFEEDADTALKGAMTQVLNRIETCLTTKV